MDEAANRCAACGHEIEASAPMREAALDAADQIPLIEWNELGKKPVETPVAIPAPPAQEASPSVQARMSPLMMIAAACAVAGVTAIIVLSSLQSTSPHQTTAVSVPAAAAAPARAMPAPTPKWVGRREAQWANDGSKTISFELQAINDVNVWMSRVRPLLVVRCLYKTTEVFVAIRSSASIEGRTGIHTVRLHIDNEQEQVQEWTDSVSGQELFAPDSVALARRLANAQRLRFSFTPYNAQPVTADFSVEGFETLAPLVGKTCGWKMDGPVSPQIRTAGLN
jgi:hypothetical protein